MNFMFPSPFRFAIEEARLSEMQNKVGACLVVGKSVYKAHNKDKTHTIFANPDVHVRLSMHAEINALIRAALKADGGEIYVYRDLHGRPALARPCEQCMPILKNAGVKRIYYSTGHFPFWKSEEL
jgi:deoxycytidylate deaminase